MAKEKGYPHREVRAQRASKDEESHADDEFASPACYAHEMDRAYMWAEPRPNLLKRALRRLARRRQP